jgi:vacuolar-type H+-ATPase subunit H
VVKSTPFFPARFLADDDVHHVHIREQRMVKEALERIQHAEEQARLSAQKAREEAAADLLEAGREADQIVRQAEAQTRQQAKTILAQAQKEGEKVAGEIQKKTRTETEKLRELAEQNRAAAIQVIKERFTAQWQ